MKGTKAEHTDIKRTGIESIDCIDMEKADLHIHSYYSDDGEFSPRELVKMCREAGIAQMAIADHNTVRGCREAMEAAKEEGIICIPAIEIDCVFEGRNLHVLGYGIDTESEDFVQIEERVRQQRLKASAIMLEKTRQLGFEVSEEALLALSGDGYWSGCFTGEMFAELLLEQEKYKEHELLKPYRKGGERADNPYVNFYWDYYAQGKPCYVPIHYPDLKTIADTIHKNGGLAVLAHPGANLKGKEQEIEKIIASGLDGAEVYSSYHTKEQTEYFAKEAERFGWKITCGSDFHGKTKPSVYLGKKVFDTAVRVCYSSKV